MPSPLALIVGAGDGLSASVARRFAKEGFRIALAARNKDKLAALCRAIGAKAFSVDAAERPQVNALFAALDQDKGTPDFVLYNASGRERGPFVDLNPAAVEQAVRVSALGGFHVAQEAAKRMLARAGQPSGSIFFTGASASVKGYAQSAAFAMGKFALRGLAQSLARELSPKNIHIAHFVIDGGIANEQRPERTADAAHPDSLLLPDAIAETYFQVHQQHRSAWTWEIELRPWVEKF